MVEMGYEASKNDRVRGHCSGPARGVQGGCRGQNSAGDFRRYTAMAAADGADQDSAAALGTFRALVVKNRQEPADRTEHQTDEKTDGLVIARLANGCADGAREQ